MLFFIIIFNITLSLLFFLVYHSKTSCCSYVVVNHFVLHFLFICIHFILDFLTSENVTWCLFQPLRTHVTNSSCTFTCKVKTFFHFFFSDLNMVSQIMASLDLEPIIIPASFQHSRSRDSKVCNVNGQLLDN